MKKITALLIVLALAAMTANVSLAEETTTETAPAEEVTTEETTDSSNIMYTQGEAYVGITAPKSKQVNSNGARVIGDSGIGIRGGYFVADNLDVSLSYVFGTWTIGTLSAGASEIRAMANYHYPFFNIGNIIIGGVAGLGYNSFNFQPTNAGGTALTGGGLIYEAGFDGRMNNFEYYIVYRMGSIAYSTLNTNLTLNCVESGINYVFDASGWLSTGE